MIDSNFIADPGELNYLITKLIHNYFNQCERQYGKEVYKAHNDVLGALLGATLEFYRKKTIPYENSKIKENGDI